jgi:hypothetical protein
VNLLGLFPARPAIFPEVEISIFLHYSIITVTLGCKRAHVATNKWRAHNPEVAGSNPAPAKKASLWTGFFMAEMHKVDCF